MTSKIENKIENFDVEWTFDHAQYWTGAGVAFTDYDEVCTGTGNTPGEAFEDALAQIGADGYDVSAIEFPHPESLDAEMECECADDEDGECEHAFIVSVRYSMPTLASNVGDLRKASEFGDEYMLSLDSQDLESINDYFPGINEGITGAFTIVADGDYDEVWVTGYSRPYENSAMYERVA